MQSTFWNTFSAAPHRLFFFSGALQLILPVLIWSIELIGRYTEFWTPLEIVIPATWAHGMVMIYGLFIFFIFGFLMTVFPRWMNGEVISKENYVATWIWLNLGLLIFEFSLFFSPSSSLSGLAIFLFGWVFGIYVLYDSFRQAPARNKTFEAILLVALTLGALGVLSFASWMYTDAWLMIELSFNIGIWLYLVPVLFTVCYRMLPFFSSNVIDNYTVYQPRLNLLLFLAGCISHFLLEQFHLKQWLFVVDIPMASLALLHSIRWQIHRSFKDRLLAVLHMAFFWLFIGLALLSLQSLMLMLNGEFLLQKAPLHAITIGFAASLLIAMASRVTLGHSGRMLHLDRVSWWLFIGLQLAALSRILSDIQFEQLLESHRFNLIALALWLVCLSIWIVKYAPIYLSRRVDGRPG